MPELEVPIIKWVRANWQATPKTIDVAINSHKFTNYYEINVVMVHAIKKYNEGKPYTYSLIPKVLRILPITLKTVEMATYPVIDHQFPARTTTQLPGGKYMCNVSVSVGWWQRVWYWDWSRPPFFRYKMMLVPDPKYPVLFLSTEMDWQ